MKEKRVTRVTNQILFLAPAVFFFSLFVIIPFLISFGTSFSKWNGVSNNFQWNGLDNYLKALGDEDFFKSLE